MARLLPIASGKGGVGKSVIAANLGLALSRPDSAGHQGRPGRTVVLVDLDLGGSNLHTFLGVKNTHAGIGSLVWKQERSLSQLLVETGYDRLWLIPGDGLMPGTANIEWFAKKRILKELQSLPADFVIIDLGAGSSYNVVDFFLCSNEGIVVIKPEITSILNAYAFLKTSAFRALSRALPEKGAARAALNEFVIIKAEGAGTSFLNFAQDLANRFPDGRAALERLSALRPRVLMNMGAAGGAASGSRPDVSGDAELGYRLRDIAMKNLGLSLSFAGYLLDDPAVPASVASRHLIVDSRPLSPFSKGLSAFASRLDMESPAVVSSIGEGFGLAGDDIYAIIGESLAAANEELA